MRFTICCSEIFLVDWKILFFLFLESIYGIEIWMINFFEIEILMDLHVMRDPESVNHIFCVWSVYMCVCMSLCVCYQHNLKTNCSRSFKFGILQLCRREIRKNSKIIIAYRQNSSIFILYILVNFSIFRLH